MEELRSKITAFIDERDWKQFHSPKNLAMAFSVEGAEVVEHFQWLTEEQSQNLPPEKVGEVKEEIGDVMIYPLHIFQGVLLLAGLFALFYAWRSIAQIVNTQTDRETQKSQLETQIRSFAPQSVPARSDLEPAWPPWQLL